MMSKELEALKRISRLIINRHGYGTDYQEEIDVIEQALNELEAYQIRNTPMKVLILDEPLYSIDNGDNIDKQPSMTIKVKRCPNCNHIVDNHYCSDCGQKLDWSENDE